MRYLLTAAAFLALAAAAGCGSGTAGPTQVNTTPLTPEQKQAILDDDQRVDEEESPGNKTRKMKPRGK